MINFNGEFQKSIDSDLLNNRGFLFGDAVFETVKIVDNKILFLEDHYFRLMASMRILRMEIPMDFTMEFFEEQIIKLAQTNSCSDSGRARITVFRNATGFYTPSANHVLYVITAESLAKKHYFFDNELYEVDLYKDFYVSKNLLSTLKTNNKIINITAGIFAKENGFQNCLLINESKNIAEAINGNLFMVVRNKVFTPALSEGCLNGILRKQVVKIIQKMTDYEIVESVISTFDLQKADELFITNVIQGVQSISRYRKKEYASDFAQKIILELNKSIETV